MRIKLRIGMFLVATTAVGVTRVGAQSSPQCKSQYDASTDVERAFSVFVDSTIADNRASLGIVTQSKSAPHGVLTKNDECEALRHATLHLLATRGDTLPQSTDMSFFLMGSYYGVFVNRPVDPNGMVVSGGSPFYVFTRAPTDSAAHSSALRSPRHKLRFVTELRL